MLVGQAVELGFLLDGGRIAVQATVKISSAFRYGFEFVLCHQEREIIARGCKRSQFGKHQNWQPRSRIDTSRFIAMTQLLIWVLLSILNHIGDKHQPAAALLDKILRNNPSE